MKKILIIGCNGSMGKRYSAICKFLKIPFKGIDIGEYFDPDDYSNFIIATPTDTHLRVARLIIDNSTKHTRILCEKPIAIVSHVVNELSDVILDAKALGHEFFMVNQYAYYPGLPTEKEPTFYNFYQSGKDGLKWDCIQIIYLARGEIILDNTSPVWECKINGLWLNRETLDECYVDMIDDFFRNSKRKLWAWDDIFKAHLKVVEYEENPNRNSGEK
jgi:hypothetical protein